MRYTPRRGGITYSIHIYIQTDVTERITLLRICTQGNNKDEIKRGKIVRSKGGKLQKNSRNSFLKCMWGGGQNTVR